MPNNSRITTLDEGFKSEFGITDVFGTKRGTQKEVYFIKRNGNKCILKLFKNFGVRDLRELDIYDRYNNLDGIPKVIDIKKHNNDTIVFEEHIEGEALNEIFAKYKEDDNSVSELILKIVDILTPLWSDGIVHRDLKPSNIIVKKDNNPVVIDFGIAKKIDSSSITTVGFQPHTWQFASPEQLLADKDKISYRTDFFSLGIIVYYLYHQKLPFGNTIEEVEKNFSIKKLSLIINEYCKLKDAILEMLKFNPSDRPAKIDKLKKLLSI